MASARSPATRSATSSSATRSSAATTGSDLKLTIDASLQAETERVLNELGQTYDPDGATAIVMDPKTSEVLAMAN